ncbi:hypothetical protein [uncultured Nocardioides sp.]|uniref:hypothetical protein n=1 Tax=uncultured Nocardioides sp. TaxID=198441 RepID=UPI0026205530|nr:hypothetical protein [uncultured Nocardioides sp.]
MTARYVRPVATGAFVLGCVAIGTWLVARDRDAVTQAAAQLAVWQLAAACGFAALAMCAMLISWVHATRACGIDLPIREGWTIFSVSQLTKYLPGGVWPIVTQTALGRSIGLPAAAMSSAGAVHLVLTVWVALSVGGALALLVLPVKGWIAWAPVMAAALTVTLWPPVLNRLLSRASRLTRRLGIELDLPSVSTRSLVSSTAWCLVANGLFALHVSALLPSPSVRASLENVGLSLVAYSLASAAGVLVVMAPAGAGAREGVLVLALTSQHPLSVALVVAVVSRVVLIGVDLVLAMTQTLRVRARVRSRLG